MVIIRLNGGLGNQLYQLSAGIAISKIRNQKLYLDIRNYSRNGDSCGRKPIVLEFIKNSNIEIITLSKLELLKISFNKYFGKNNNNRYSARVYSESKFENSSSLIYFKPYKQFLDGWFGQIAFLNNSIADISILFANYLSLNNHIIDVYNDLKNKLEGFELCSIHLRRGDYLSNDSIWNKLTYNNYYSLAINELKSRVKNNIAFVIFSDDIEEAKNELIINEKIFFFNSSISDLDQLVLMSLTDHHIIANSTFSSWGALLNNNNNKIILYPNKWFIKEEYQTFFVSNKNFPDNFIEIQ